MQRPELSTAPDWERVLIVSRAASMNAVLSSCSLWLIGTLGEPCWAASPYRVSSTILQLAPSTLASCMLGTKYTYLSPHSLPPFQSLIAISDFSSSLFLLFRPHTIGLSASISASLWLSTCLSFPSVCLCPSPFLSLLCLPLKKRSLVHRLRHPHYL